MAVPEEESVGRRRVEKTHAVDRLSDLPESVIIHILSFMETKNAVRTSVLSQQWRSLWTSVPTLSLCFSDFRVFAQFQRFIEKALGHHHKLNKLLLDLRHPDCVLRAEFVREHIDSWLQHAVNRDVGTLHLDGFRGYMLPELLFRHSSLTMLSTKQCNYKFIPRVSWGSLTFLSIDACYKHNSFNCLTSILSGSPVLQHLELISYCFPIFSSASIFSFSLKKLSLKYISGFVKISAPKLETLEISGRWEAIRQVNLPALVEASLRSARVQQESVLQLLQDISHAEKLVVGHFFWHALSKLDVNKLHSNLNCSVLHIWIEELDLAIDKLLQVSPFLHTLVINISKPEVRYVSCRYDKKCWSSSKGTKSKCLKHSLKTVTINIFNGEDSNSLMIVPFVEFLLREAQGLENLNIYYAGGGSCECVGTDPKLSKLANQLLNLPRSSQSVVVAFHA